MTVADLARLVVRHWLVTVLALLGIALGCRWAALAHTAVNGTVAVIFLAPTATDDNVLAGTTAALVDTAGVVAERINGPVLAISGKDDAMWPSSVYGDMVLERLAEHLHPYPDQHLSYAGTGHSVGQPWWPTTITKTLHPVSKTLFALGGDPQQSAHARADADHVSCI